MCKKKKTQTNKTFLLPCFETIVKSESSDVSSTSFQSFGDFDFESASDDSCDDEYSSFFIFFLLCFGFDLVFWLVFFFDFGVFVDFVDVLDFLIFFDFFDLVVFVDFVVFFVFFIDLIF